jgi:regulator of replication initiation timing
MFEKSPQIEGRVTRLEEKMKSTHEHIVDIKAQLHSLKDSNQKIYELMIESRK